jgi:hypothetical protein
VASLALRPERRSEKFADFDERFASRAQARFGHRELRVTEGAALAALHFGVALRAGGRERDELRPLVRGVRLGPHQAGFEQPIDEDLNVLPRDRAGSGERRDRLGTPAVKALEHASVRGGEAVRVLVERLGYRAKLVKGEANLARQGFEGRGRFR